MIDAFGHVCYLLLFLGQVLLTRRSAGGWVLRGVGDLGWIVLGVLLGMTSIWMWGFLFLLNDIRGYLSWRDHETSRGEVISQDAA